MRNRLYSACLLLSGLVQIPVGGNHACIRVSQTARHVDDLSISLLQPPDSFAFFRGNQTLMLGAPSRAQPWSTNCRHLHMRFHCASPPFRLDEVADQASASLTCGCAADLAACFSNPVLSYMTALPQVDEVTEHWWAGGLRGARQLAAQDADFRRSLADSAWVRWGQEEDCGQTDIHCRSIQFCS